MTERLTPVFERRIRMGLLHQWEESGTAITALLAELDAVRQERDALTAQRASLQQDNIALKSRLCNHCYREVDDPTAAKSQAETLTLHLATARKALELIAEQTYVDVHLHHDLITRAAKEALADMKVACTPENPCGRCHSCTATKVE